MPKPCLFLLAAVAAGVVSGAVPAAAAEPPKLVVAAGPKGTPDFVFAQTLCTAINRQPRRYRLACAVKESAGDVASLKMLDGDEANLAFSRSDRLDQALNGTGPFRDRRPVLGSGQPRESGPNPDFRALFSLQIDTLIVLARADSGAKSAADLARKRINIGPPGSGPRAMFDLVAPAVGWALPEFNVAAELKPADEADALCRDRVDAVLYLGANPDPLVRAATQACAAAPVPVSGAAIDDLVKRTRYLVPAAIPGGLYKGTPREVRTIGFATVAVSSSKVDAGLVRAAVRAVFEHLGGLQRADPVFQRLDPRRMIALGLVAPLHDGAARFYRERGWVR